MAKDFLKQKLGIIGGGQLGKMMILEAKKLGFYVIILDPSKNCPASSITDEHIISDFNDINSIKLLSEKADVITYEFEHINVNALFEIEASGKKVYPSPKSLKIIQDKFTQKEKLKEAFIPVPEFLKISSYEELVHAAEQFSYPFLLKTCTGGYDGKGNFLVKSAEQLNEAYAFLGSGKIPLMAEKFIDFLMEVSVLACRGIDGSLEIFPVAKNIHKENILELTLAPAPIEDKIAEKAMNIAGMVLHLFEDVGIFCIEMFISKEHQVYVNEIAPRPHNSGHYTIEACASSQFEQHIRAIAGLPLGSAALVRPSAMINILGEDGYSGPAYADGIEKALSVKGAHIHIYGKEMTSPKRKMGHITACGDTLAEAELICREAKKYIRIISK